MHLDVHTLLTHYGYFGVFLILLLEMVGIPFPAETTLVLSGIAWIHGTLLLVPLLLASAAGNIVGSVIAYGIGRFLRPWLVRLGRYVGISDERLDRVGKRVMSHQRSIIISSKFIAGLRVLVPYVAGIHRMPFIPFLIYTSVGAFAWTTAFVVLGRYIGAGWRQVHHYLKGYTWPVAGGLVVIAAGYFSLRKWGQRSKRQETQEHPSVNRSGLSSSEE